MFWDLFTGFSKTAYGAIVSIGPPVGVDSLAQFMSEKGKGNATKSGKTICQSDNFFLTDILCFKTFQKY